MIKQSKSGSVLILGNGPSLRNFDFHSLDDQDSIGMNVAFRHWHKINWYPTYYTCLDTVMIETHKDSIRDLIVNYDDRIRLYFIRKIFLKYHPDLRGNPHIIYLEDYYNSPYFSGILNLLTTGSFAPLFAAMLGYRRAYLLGIDLNQVERIPESKHVDGHILEITETPRHNPNYFFDGYQLKGERYNIPNSTPDLHYKSWVEVKKRLEHFNFDVINCNLKSKLDIFEYSPLPADFVRSRRLTQEKSRNNSSIVFFGMNPRSGFSGGRYHAWMLAEALSEKGWDVSFITTAIPPFYDDFNDENLYPSHGKIKIFISRIIDEKPKLPDIPCDILLVIPHNDCHGPFADNAISFAQKTKARICLLNFETPNWFNAYSIVKRPESKWNGWKQISSQASLILSLANEGTKFAEHFYTELLPNAKFSHCWPTINSRVADKIPESSKNDTILFFTRFSHAEHKGSEIINELISSDLEGFTVKVIIGVGSHTNDAVKPILNKARTHNVKITFLESISEKQKWHELKQAKLLVYPSYFEGFGLPPVEAMYAGTPCIAFDLPVLREVSGDNIIYVPPGDTRLMRQKMAELLDHYKNYDYLKEYISKKNSYDIFMERIDATISRMLETTPVPPEINNTAKKLKVVQQDSKNTAQTSAIPKDVIGGVSESTVDDEGSILIRGWLLGPQQPDRIVVSVNDNNVGEAILKQPREDIYRQYPEYREPNSGYIIKHILSEYNPDNLNYKLSFYFKNKLIRSTKGKIIYKATIEPDSINAVPALQPQPDASSATENINALYYRSGMHDLVERWLRQSSRKTPIVLFVDPDMHTFGEALAEKYKHITSVITVPQSSDNQSESERFIYRLRNVHDLDTIVIPAPVEHKTIEFIPGAMLPDIGSFYSLIRIFWLGGIRHFLLFSYGGLRRLNVTWLLDAFHDKHKNNRCFVIGNGPSLNLIDMSLLKNEITLGSNRCYMGFDKWGFKVNYWGILDRLQVEVYGKEYEDNIPQDTVKFFPFEYMNLLEFNNVCPVNMDYNWRPPYRFSGNPNELYLGFTVTHMLLQIAAIMGCNPIYLIGCDHNYNISNRKSAERKIGIKDARVWVAEDSSQPTHFTSDYTNGQNRQFILPNPKRAEASFEAAKNWSMKHGVEIINATPNTKLKVFPTVDYQNIFKSVGSKQAAATGHKFPENYPSWATYRRDVSSKMITRIECAERGRPLTLNDGKIAALKDLHKGKIGWLIGNGPSVKTDDLNLLCKEISFGCNRIYLAYHQMEFRPTYLCSTDRQMIRDFGQEMIDNHPGKVLLVADEYPDLKGKFTWFRQGSTTPLQFSTNVYDFVMPGGGTLITAVQIGFHMGIKKFYIYGMDHNFKFEENKESDDHYNKAMGDGNHFIKNYRSGKKWAPPVPWQVEGALLSCRVFLENRGGWIKNATRGGNLEVLDRVDFDNVTRDYRHIKTGLITSEV